MKRLLFILCFLPLLARGANIDFRNLNINHFTTNGYKVSLKNFPTNSTATNYITALASNYFLTTTGSIGTLVNPNLVWVATNGIDATADGSYNKPFAGVSNAAAYARATYRDNWAVGIRSGRYNVGGGHKELLDETNRSPVNVHGATNVAFIGEGRPILFTTNLCLLGAWAVDGLTVNGIVFEGQKHTNIGLISSFINLRGGTRNVTINDCFFRQIPDHAIAGLNSSRGATNVLVQGCSFYDVGATNGAGALISDGACVVPNGNCWTIANCTFDRFLRGVEPYPASTTMTNINNIVVANNVMTRCWGNGVLIIPQVGSVSNMLVTGNVFTDTESAGLSREFLRATSGRGVDVHNNLIDGPMEFAIVLISGATEGLRDWTVANNTIRNNPIITAGIYTDHDGAFAWTNMTFRDNKFINLFGRAILLRGSGSLVVGNEMVNVGQEGAGSAAIRMDSPSNTTRFNLVVDNVIKPAAGADGIQILTGATNNTFTGNYVESWGQHPITDANPVGHNYLPFNRTTNGLGFTGTNINRVGINTNNPANSLHVQGSAKFDANNSATDFQVSSYVADEMRLFWRGGTGGLNTNFFGNGVGSIGSQSFSFFTVNTQRWRVTGLSADGVRANLGDIYPDVDVGYSLGTPDRRLLNGHFNGVIITNGNVGIDTTAPGEKLHVVGNTTVSGYGTFGGGVSFPIGISLAWQAGPAITAPSANIVTIAGDSVLDRVQFGGATASFPALKRDGAGLALIGANGVGSSGNNLAISGIVTATNGLASFATNIVASINAAGYTNSPTAPGTGTGINMNVHVVGTSGTVVFYNRSGVNGQTVCGTPLWTNTTAIPIGMVIPVPVNCGIQIVSGVGVTMQAYAQ